MDVAAAERVARSIRGSFGCPIFADLMTTEQIWTAYSAGLLKYFKAKTRDASLAEDLRQEVFLRVHSRLGSLREEQRAQHWLSAIAHNVLADHWKTDKRKKDLRLESPRDDDSQGELAESCVRNMIDTLPEQYALPLRMSDIEGMKQQEIAERLSLNLSATKSRIQRGREKLRSAIVSCCHVELNKRGEIVDSKCSNGHCSQCAA
jgi:RNA polymerase sigma-70 factor, ECF subfamily